MRVLLDENIPHLMRQEFVTHELSTVAYMGWDGLKNGRLLAAAAEAGFEAFLTIDRGIEYEQNLAKLPIAVVILMVASNKIELIRPLYPALDIALRELRLRSVVKVSPPTIENAGGR